MTGQAECHIKNVLNTEGFNAQIPYITRQALREFDILPRSLTVLDFLYFTDAPLQPFLMKSLHLAPRLAPTSERNGNTNETEHSISI